MLRIRQFMPRIFVGREHGMSDLVAARKFLHTADKLDPLTFYNVYM